MKPVQPNEYSSRLSCAERLNQEKRTSFKRPTGHCERFFFFFIYTLINSIRRIF